MNYVTTQTIATSLDDVNWAATGDGNTAVLLANSWLSGKRLPLFAVGQVPIEILAAGAYIAKEIIAGNMYQSSKEGVVTAKTVKVGEVSTSKTFSSNDVSQLLTVGEQIANTLIAPYLLGMVVVVPLGRF